ncbi:MAG TPA: hypothetical protein VMZ53_06225, partial [Kofleriaceae bacterium]|nr:hypothetical protein [Kofleriaceae bacterium]
MSRWWSVLAVVAFGCGGSDGDDGPNPPPAPSCAPAGGGSTTVAIPTLAYTLADRYQEAWLGSPAVADLDADGVDEIIVPRHELLIVWHPDGTIAWQATLPGRIWASPVVADLVP